MSPSACCVLLTVKYVSHIDDVSVSRGSSSCGCGAVVMVSFAETSETASSIKDLLKT